MVGGIALAIDFFAELFEETNRGTRDCKMPLTFAVKNLFRLPDGLTALACEGDGEPVMVIGRSATLRNGGDLRQRIQLRGERKMLRQERPKSFRAFETNDTVQLSVDEVQTGAWILTLED